MKTKKESDDLLFGNPDNFGSWNREGALDAQQILDEYQSKIDRIRKIEDPVTIRVSVRFPNIERAIDHITLSSKDAAGPSLRFEVASRNSPSTQIPQSEKMPKPKVESPIHLTLSSGERSKPTVRATLSSAFPEKRTNLDSNLSRHLEESERRIIDLANRIAAQERQERKVGRQNSPDANRQPNFPLYFTGLPSNSTWNDQREVVAIKIPKPMPGALERQLPSDPKVLAQSISHLTLSAGKRRESAVQGSLSLEDTQRIIRGEITAIDVARAIDQVTISYTPGKIAEVAKKFIADAMDISLPELTVLQEKWVQRK